MLFTVRAVLPFVCIFTLLVFVGLILLATPGAAKLNITSDANINLDRCFMVG